MKPVEQIVIDDLRSFRDPQQSSTVYARDSQSGISVLKEYLISGGVRELWLDHDLGVTADGTEDNIMSVVDWLSLQAFEGNQYPVDTIFIHTSNPVGRRDIERCLQRWGYRTIIIIDASEMFVVEN